MNLFGNRERNLSFSHALPSSQRGTKERMRNLISLPLFAENDFDKRRARTHGLLVVFLLMPFNVLLGVAELVGASRRSKRQVHSSDMIDHVWQRRRRVLLLLLLKTSVRRAPHRPTRYTTALPIDRRRSLVEWISVSSITSRAHYVHT